MVNYLVGRPNIGDRSLLKQNFEKILDDSWLTNNGPFLQQLELKLAQYCGVRHCVVVANGTLALELAIRALELKGEVILPSFTFIATAHALQWHGIQPVFCDINPKTFCVDPQHAESLVSNKTAAIMGVHVYGQTCDTDALDQIASARHLPLIYDAAHALGCARDGRMIGGFGNCEVFSFHATKVLNTIEGGAITTNDDALAERLRRMRNFGFPGDGSDSTVELGTNAKMNEFCAAMGLANLESLDAFIAANKSNYDAYRQGFASIPGIQLFEFDERDRNNYQYVIALVNQDEFGHDRDALLQELHSHGVMARRYFYPGCHSMEPYRTMYPNAAESLPVTEAIVKQVMALPTGTQLGPPQVQEICERIRRFQANG